MKLSCLFKGLSIKFPYKDIEVTDITNDSRKVKKGSLFVCIDGVNADGHNYAKKAVQNGASVILTQKKLGLENEINVSDTRYAYSIICANFFGNPAQSLKLIGVTGTNGKTSITYIIKHILEKCGYKTGLIGTIHNMVNEEIFETNNTTPDAYELQKLFAIMKEKGCEYCVMEVSSHAIEQGRMAGCNYECSIFTNLTQDHLDYHGTMENYMNVKKKLFEVSKTGVFNIDDDYAEKMIKNLKCEIVTYGIKNKADFTVENIVCKPDGVQYDIEINSEKIKIIQNIPGVFSVYNSLCALVCMIKLGLPVKDIVAALKTSTGIKGRAEVVPTGKDFTVIIDYAHTPDGLVNIINAMREVKNKMQINPGEKGDLTVLFGCGGDRDRTKRPLMAKAVMELSDKAIITSDNPRTEQPSKIIEDILEGTKGYKIPYIVIENRKEAIKYAIKNAKTNDIIILAGKGHETYQILKDGTIHFDEREVVKEALNELN